MESIWDLDDGSVEAVVEALNGIADAIRNQTTALQIISRRRNSDSPEPPEHN